MKKKFRVWDNKNKEWITDDAISDYNICAVTINHVFNHRYLDGDIMFEQFTNSKDETGKEIYEGDIVTRPNHAGYEVVELENFIYLKLLNCGCPEVYTIIGNIHENPELLNLTSAQ